MILCRAWLLLVQALLVGFGGGVGGGGVHIIGGNCASTNHHAIIASVCRQMMGEVQKIVGRGLKLENCTWWFIFSDEF